MKKIIEFLNLIGNLKFEKRKGWIQHGISNKVESVADHSFRTALITLILSDYWKKKGLNPERMLKMALLHDLPEAIIGDITPRDEISDKRKKENEAMKTLINLINDFKEIDNIWDDFFEQKSEEARLVFQIDKLEMAIQALEYGGKNNSKIYSEFFLSVEKNILDPKLKEIYNSLKS